MTKSVVEISSALLEADDEPMEELRVHEFEDDRVADDDKEIEKLYAEFKADLEGAEADLTRAFGKPSQRGEADNDLIPLNGVFQFAIWDVEGRSLYLAAAHEDRGVPILLVIGATD